MGHIRRPLDHSLERSIDLMYRFVDRRDRCRATLDFLTSTDARHTVLSIGCELPAGHGGHHHCSYNTAGDGSFASQSFYLDWEASAEATAEAGAEASGEAAAEGGDR